MMNEDASANVVGGGDIATATKPLTTTPEKRKELEDSLKSLVKEKTLKMVENLKRTTKDE